MLRTPGIKRTDADLDEKYWQHYHPSARKMNVGGERVSRLFESECNLFANAHLKRPDAGKNKVYCSLSS